VTTASKDRKKITIEDVARAASVGKTTVSFVFNNKGNISEKTRLAVLRAADELGFEPNPHARLLVNGRCDSTIGLFSMDFDLSVGARKIKNIQRALVREGLHVPVYLGSYGTESDKVALLKLLRQQKPRAIVCNTLDLPQVALDELHRFQDEGGLSVCYDFPIDMECDQVIFDRQDNTYQATRHLLELGHRNIGLCLIGPRIGGPRFEGFKQALDEFGAPLKYEWLSSLHGREEFEDYGIKLSSWFLGLAERPTAMCIVNDDVAQTFISHLQYAGVQVPRDLSVVGHDDSPSARYGIVQLTSVSHPVNEIVDNVVSLLHNRLDGYDGQARRILLRGQLVERHSTAPPKSE
jgi:DNA-binding LacI/PurR family transcriptional regulator